MSEGTGYKVQIIIAIIGLIGIIATGVLSNWDKLFTKSRQVPVPTTEHPPPVTNGKNIENSSRISGKYLMDKQNNRVIVISDLVGNEIRIEEPTSPWPWTGTAIVTGNKLSGRAHFPKSKATMTVEGILRGDGSIEVDYHFITKGDGSLAEGRVDHHVWYPD